MDTDNQTRSRQRAGTARRADLDRLYGKIGISAVAAALSCAKPAKAKLPHSDRPKAALRDEDAAA